MNNVVDTARQEGQAEGERTAQVLIATSLLGTLSTKEISEVTGLSATEVESLEQDS